MKIYINIYVNTIVSPRVRGREIKKYNKIFGRIPHVRGIEKLTFNLRGKILYIIMPLGRYY